MGYNERDKAAMKKELRDTYSKDNTEHLIDLKNKPIEVLQQETIKDVKEIELFKCVKMSVSPTGYVHFSPIADIGQQRNGLFETLVAIELKLPSYERKEDTSIMMPNSPTYSKAIDHALRCHSYSPASILLSSPYDIVENIRSRIDFNEEEGAKISDLPNHVAEALRVIRASNACGAGLHCCSYDVARYTYGATSPRGGSVIIRVSVRPDRIFQVSPIDMDGLTSGSNKVRSSKITIGRKCIVYFNKPTKSEWPVNAPIMSEEQFNLIQEAHGCQLIR